MTTEMLIGIQVLAVLLLGIGMLLLLLRRQRKTIAELESILTTFKDDLSGDTVLRFLNDEIDLTTAHCSQDAVDLKTDMSPEELAVGLRFHALRMEHSLLQERANAEIPWRDQIKRYEGLASKVLDQMRARLDQSTKTLNDVHNRDLAVKDQIINELSALRDDQKRQLQNLKPLQDFISAATIGVQTPLAMEQLLHRALLGLCENFPGSEKLRELVFLMHESFNEIASRSSTGTPTPVPVQDRKTLRIDPAQNLDMLNNIISRQNETIRNLRRQIEVMGGETGKQGLLDAVAIMELTVDSTRQCVESLDQGLEFLKAQPPADSDNADMIGLIEQFTNESAVMVEKIYLLSNLNKQLTIENDQLRAALENTAEQDQPIVEGMKLKLEKQKNEIIGLQQNFKELEEKYLQLYQQQTVR
ncbi:MAG TPA: hypothetical protein VM553_11635 [Dongiaceae bacterium]|nr:hypothetical protein [Dongiaceae bacterium]